MRWLLVAGAGAERERIRSRIADKCRAIFGELLLAEVQFVDDIPAQAPGKFPLVERSGGAEDDAGAL